jgi:hypothetical protein
VKAVITNPSKQHAEVHHYRVLKGGEFRLDRWNIPMGESVEVEIPSSEDNDQRQLVTDQCRALGLSFREGTL